jgi:asparagine synthase (glutamine-hydrolysing)
MCGIAGLLLSDAPANQGRAAVGQMIAGCRHRGPDTAGYAEIPLPSGALVLGHARLSIIDLSDSSSQPMHDSAASWLVYNGEIYNFRELRQQLEELGVRFRTTGDTEVLLKALLQWGEHALPKVEGMFAFAFWDAAEQQLLLARDPMGIKPLYFHAGPHRFAFASEVKALARAELCPLTVDRSAVESFLAFGAVIGPRTIYQEIRELEPGHLLRVNAGAEVTKSRYWSLQDCLKGHSSSIHDFEDAVVHIRERLDHAVQSHLVSDVPVGVFLSGGVDSSLLALLASRHTDSPLTLLTVAFPEQEFSELPYAQQIARKLPHRHEVVMLSSGQLRGLLPEALASMDQPTVDGMNTFVISRVGAARGLKVLLTGIGGDELFGGYTTFYKVPMLRRYGALLRPMAGLVAGNAANPIQWKKISSAGRFRDTTDSYLLQRSIRWANGFSNSVADQLRQAIEPLHSDFQKLAALELQFYARNQLLRDADVFSMANSVELRVPLLDSQLLAAALSLPAKFHFEGKKGKRLTRRILSDLVGEEIPQRRKMGFTFPWQQWLANGLKETISEMLLAKEGYGPLGLDPAYGKQLLQGLERKDRTQSWTEVWSLFVLLNWQLKTEVQYAAA